jgi:hypothetical protein
MGAKSSDNYRSKAESGVPTLIRRVCSENRFLLSPITKCLYSSPQWINPVNFHQIFWTPFLNWSWYLQFELQYIKDGEAIHKLFPSHLLDSRVRYANTLSQFNMHAKMCQWVQLFCYAWVLQCLSTVWLNFVLFAGVVNWQLQGLFMHQSKLCRRPVQFTAIVLPDGCSSYCTEGSSTSSFLSKSRKRRLLVRL